MLQGDFMVCLSIFHDYQANVEEFLSTVLDSTKTSCSELGQLEAPAVVRRCGTHEGKTNRDLSSMICLGRGFGPSLRPSQTC